MDDSAEERALAPRGASKLGGITASEKEHAPVIKAIVSNDTAHNLVEDALTTLENRLLPILSKAADEPSERAVPDQDPTRSNIRETLEVSTNRLQNYRHRINKLLENLEI